MSKVNQNKEILLNKFICLSKYSEEIVKIYFNEEIKFSKTHPLIMNGYIFENKDYYILSSNLKNLLRDMLPNANFKFEINQSKIREDIKLFILENKMSNEFDKEYEDFLINIVNDIYKDIILLDMKVDINFNRSKSLINRKALFDNYMDKYKELNTLIKQLKNYSYFEDNFIYTSEIKNIENISRCISNEIDKLLLESKTNETLDKLGKLKNEDKHKKNYLLVNNFLKQNKNPLEKYNQTNPRLNFVSDFKSESAGKIGLFLNNVTDDEQEAKSEALIKIKSDFNFKLNQTCTIPVTIIHEEEPSEEIDYLKLFVDSMKKIDKILETDNKIKLSEICLSQIEKNTILSDLICFSNNNSLSGKYNNINFTIATTKDLQKEYIDIVFSGDYN